MLCFFFLPVGSLIHEKNRTESYHEQNATFSQTGVWLDGGIGKTARHIADSNPVSHAKKASIRDYKLK